MGTINWVITESDQDKDKDYEINRYTTIARFYKNTRRC